MNKVTDYCKDINEWANRWNREEDIDVGERILRHVFVPFFEFLIEKQLTKKTIIKHMDNIWLLGGEIIDGVNFDEELRKINEFKLVLEFIDSDGGLVSSHNETQAEERSYDSSCKKLYNYLKSNNQLGS